MKIYRLFVSVLLLSMLALTANALKAETNENAEVKNSSKFSPEQTLEIQQIVRNYLIEHPEVLIEVSHALQQKDFLETQERVAAIVKGNIKEMLHDHFSPVAGNPKGDITIIEFFDYQCGVCRRIYPTTEELLKLEPEVQIIYKQFPVIAPSSQLAAKASVAAYSQDPKKWKAFHVALLEADIGPNNQLTEDRILAVAQKVGLDSDKLKQGMQKSEVSKQLNADLALAEALQLIGTPSFIVLNNTDKLDDVEVRYISGGVALSGFQEVIKEIRTKSKNE